MSWLKSGHHAVGFFPSGGSYSICKTTQEYTLDTESVTTVLIINCLVLYQKTKGWWAPCRVLLSSKLTNNSGNENVNYIIFSYII